MPSLIKPDWTKPPLPSSRSRGGRSRRQNDDIAMRAGTWRHTGIPNEQRCVHNGCNCRKTISTRTDSICVMI